MNKPSSRLMSLAIAAAFGASLALAPSMIADHHEEEEVSLSSIMKKGHKGKTSLVAKVKNGEASDSELKTLIGMYLAMEKLEPPRGDAGSWKAKTDKLVRTSIDVFAKKDGAVDAFGKAVNCKACHKVHKED